MELRLDEVGKTYPSGVRAVDEVSLTVTSGECLALVGPSGCGKSTLLRLIAGLETPSEGTIHWDGVPVNGLPPDQRNVAMLFQRPAFHTEKSVRNNLRMAWTLGDPLATIRRWLGGEKEREAQVSRLAQLFGLAGELDRPVGQLSGGQQQRVALARCLLRNAKITLLDEPLGHLDAPLRVELRRQIRMLAREAGLTLIHVTHDPVEAFAVGDRVAVMRDGRFLQIDAPRQLRRAPAHRFVAELVHHEDGGFNWLDGEIVKDGVEAHFVSPLGHWPVSLQIQDHLRESLYQGENFHANQGRVDMMIGIPAAHVSCTTAVPGPDDDIRISAQVRELESSVDRTWVMGQCQNHPWIGWADEGECFERGQTVTMKFSMNRVYWFDRHSGRTLCAPTG